MEMSELIAYASEKYQIREERKWADFPGFSVLCHPQTGKWVALLMRQWDTETGEEIERCDIKCGSGALGRLSKPYLAPPLRMRGGKWISVAFDHRTESGVVRTLFDTAIRENAPHGYTLVLGSPLSSNEGTYKETALPFAESGYRPPKENIPQRLRELRRLYDYGPQSEQSKARTFYRQAMFMRDYEDDLPWTGDFVCYFPTYQDMTIRQLRGYFTWRAAVRRGDFRPIAASAAYLYVYELLNGIEADSPKEVLEKLRAFQTGYLDSGIGDGRMRTNLRRWMLEYAILRGLPPETARQFANENLLARDAALAALKEPDACDDPTLFAALCALGGKKIAESPVVKADPRRGASLFSAAWRNASAYRREEKRLFTLCFGKKSTRRWYPLSNAVFRAPSRVEEIDCALSDQRRYRRKNGLWQVTAYDPLFFDLALFRGFLRETDARLRRYLKTGRYLKENPAHAWAIPYIDAAIEADQKEREQAAKPTITIDFSGLEKIRREAAGTRDSLLVEEEPEEADEAAVPAEDRAAADLPLDAVQVQILRALLRGEDPAEMIKANHLMPSIAADFINEALIDEIGDTVLRCEDDHLTLAEDYIEDLRIILGGYSHG